MIVADTSLIASFFLEIELTYLAKQVHQKDPIWIFPTIWREEYANVLAKFARKDKGMPDEEVLNHFDYTISELELHERKINLSATLKTALRYKISVYDAHFVQLSIDQQVLLITEDQEVLKKCPGLALSMKNFLQSK